MPGILVDIPYAFELTARRKRGRGWITQWANDIIRVEIPVRDDLKTVAIQSSKKYGSRSFLHDGQDFFNPLQIPHNFHYRDAPESLSLPLETFLAVTAGNLPIQAFSRWLGLPDMPHDQPTITGESLKQMEKTKVTGSYSSLLRLDDRIAAILSSKQSEAILQAQTAASRLVISNGHVYVRGPEPTLHKVLGYDDHFNATVEIDRNPETYGWYLPLTSDYASAPDYELKIIDPGVFQFDPIVGNVRSAVAAINVYFGHFNISKNDLEKADLQLTTAIAGLDVLRGSFSAEEFYTMVEELLEIDDYEVREKRFGGIVHLLAELRANYGLPASANLQMDAMEAEGFRP